MVRYRYQVLLEGHFRLHSAGLEKKWELIINVSQNPAKFRQYVSESSAQQNFTEGQIIQEWKKSSLFKKTKYLSAPTKALINLCSWHLWTNNKLIVKQIRWVSWPKCLVASWSALLKLIRKINWLLHNIVWNQRQIDYMFNSIYRLIVQLLSWSSFQNMIKAWNFPHE